MKTAIKKAVVLTLTSFSSLFLFAQVNLGLSSATQATTSIAANTAAVTTISGQLTQATRSAVSTISTRATSAIQTTREKASALATQTRGNIKNSAEVNTSASVNAGSDASVSSNIAGSNSQSAVETNAGIDISGKELADKAQAATAKTTSAVKNKADATMQKANDMASHAKTEVNSVTASAATAKPEASVAAETKSSAAVSATKQ